MTIEKKNFILKTPGFTMAVIPETFEPKTGILSIGLFDYEGKEVRRTRTVYDVRFVYDQRELAQSFIREITLDLRPETIAIRQDARLWNSLVQVATRPPKFKAEGESNGEIFDPNHLGTAQQPLLAVRLAVDESPSILPRKEYIGDLVSSRSFIDGEYHTSYQLHLHDDRYSGFDRVDRYHHIVHHSAWETHNLADDIDIVTWLLNHPALAKHKGNFYIPPENSQSPIITYTDEEREIIESILNDTPLPKKRPTSKKSATK